jgi:hypothetical protein
VLTNKDQLNQICCRKDLVVFLTELHQNFKRDPKSWENDNLGAFLEALAAWSADMDGYYKNSGQVLPETPEWKTFAEMLLAARIYE